MNKKYLTDNVGKRFRLVPPAYHVAEDGKVTMPPEDDWHFEGYENRILYLRNVRTNSKCLLGDDSVHSYRTDPARGQQYGHLILLAQLFVYREVVQYTPMTRPDERVSPAPKPLLGEAYLEVSLDCHSWKNAFLDIHGWEIPQTPLPLGDVLTNERLDVWDAIAAHCVPSYSEQNYSKYRDLFLAPLILVKSRFDRALTVFQHVLPHDFQAELVRGARQLGVEFQTYGHIPSLLKAVPGFEVESLFRSPFVAVIETLKAIARDADQRRAALIQSGLT